MDGYSRRIAFLKVMLPLAALAILSSLFLLSRGSDPNASIPFSDVEIAERVRQQQITAPRFVGTTENGDEVVISAKKAIPGGKGAPGEAQGIRGEIQLSDGGAITFEAERGSVNVPDDSADFEGKVTIRTDTGYELLTDSLKTAIRRVEAIAPGNVTGAGPLGDLEAGAMYLSAKDNDPNAIHLVFTKGVKLLYHPNESER